MTIAPDCAILLPSYCDVGVGVAQGRFTLRDAAGARESGRGVTGDSSFQSAAGGSTPQDEARLLADLRRGDEGAFMRLVERYQTAMVRLAQVYVGDLAVAEEVAQEAWFSALKHLGHFEARSSFKTWLFHILVNGAKTRGQRERRSLPFSALAEAEDADGDDGPSVAPNASSARMARILVAGWRRRRAGSISPKRVSPRKRRMSASSRPSTSLPQNQRSVIRLRDVEGYSAEEVCEMLGIGAANQRVLLHRARSRVREALETYFHDD